MKKKIAIIAVALALVVAGTVYAAAAKKSQGTVVKYEGNTITIELKREIDTKAGETVRVEALKGGASLQGC